MDWVLLGTRVVDVGSAMIGFGGAIIGGLYLQPTAQALGKAGQPFTQHLMKWRPVPVMTSGGSPREEKRPSI